MKSLRLGFIGAGNMGSAIIKSVVKSGQYKPSGINIFDISKEKLNSFVSENIKIAESEEDVVIKSDIIFLAVKPQSYEYVLSKLKHIITKDKTLVSIAAGISTKYILDNIKTNCHIVRAMPNTPLLIGQGATALCSANMDNDIFNEVINIFSCSGEVEVLDEDKMNAVIAVNGSSPAYIYLLSKAVIDYAVSKGIDYKSVLNLISQTLIGSAKMLKESGYTPDTLIDMVSSPGGTTIEALKVLNDKGFYQTIVDAMKSCTDRASQLSI